MAEICFSSEIKYMSILEYLDIDGNESVVQFNVHPIEIHRLVIHFRSIFNSN